MIAGGFKDEDLEIPESNEESLTQTLAIAHYNLGVEFEHSFEYHKAQESYQEAHNFSIVSANTEHLNKQIFTSLAEVNLKLNSMKSMEKQRTQQRDRSKVAGMFQTAQVVARGDRSFGSKKSSLTARQNKGKGSIAPWKKHTETSEKRETSRLASLPMNSSIPASDNEE